MHTPTPTDDGFTVARNSSNNSLDVLANDTDPNAEDLTISLLSGSTTQGGTVSVSDNGTPVDPTDDFVIYTPPVGFSGVDNFTYHVTNQSSFCSSADVTVTVNGLPTGDNNTVATNEDVTYIFSTADFTVNYNDANGDPFAEIRITNLESVGSLLLGGTPVALNDVITAAQLTANQLTFVPVANQSGSPYDTFDFEVGDGLNFSAADYTLTVNVNAVNDPPTGDDNTVATNEDITYTFSVADFTVNYNDTESDPFAEIRITSLESVGSLLLGGTPVALNDVITAAQLTANQLTFVPVANQSGSPYDTFDFEVGDGTDFSTADYTLTVNVNAVNDPPTGDDNTVATNEDVTYTFSVADFTVNYNDTESDPFAEIRITSLESVGSLLLGGTPVALNDVITAAQLTANQLTFVPVANQSGSPYDTFDFEVGDGTDFSTADYTLTVNVNAVNDPPTGDDNTVATNEDITYTFTVADFTVNYSDPESSPFAEIRITSLESVGSLLLGGTPVALNDVITAAQLTANQLTFVPVANQSGSPYDTFDFEVGDGTDFSTADYTLTVNVNPVNDPPTGDNNTVATNEDITYTFSVADFTVNYSDTESDPFAEIRITSLESVGSLLLGGTPVALNDVITAAQLTANQLTFVPVANQSGSPYDTFDFEVGDGTDFSTADYTLTVNVNPVNDPPTGDNNTVATNEDITYTFSVADFTVNYSDTESDPFAEIRITSLESVGSLLLGGTPVALNDVITAAQLTANQLTFVPVANQSGSPYDTFDFEVGDGTDFSTADYTLTVNVNAVNDPPTGDDNTVATNEDVTYTFSVVDFTVNYNDPESSPFAEIRITNLESVGSLLLGGTPAALNDVITAAQLTANQLTFVPVANQSGSPYDTFDFEVGDGTDFSTADYTLTVNVNAVNDPPTGDDNTVATNEDVTYTFSVADFTVNYNDPESDPFAEIRITSLESVGSLLLGGTPVALNDVITAAQLTANQLTFVPVANQSGSPYDTFDFEVGDGTDFSTADYTLTVNVNAVNDPPTGDDNTVATNEDVTYTFSVADFTVNYSDPESNPFAEIRITSLESVGSLLLGGVPVALNDVITAAQLTANQLTFVPVANQSGAPYDTFDFEVGDGTDFSTADYTLTVNVNAVNDPPTGDDNTVATNEDVTYTFSVADFTVNYNDTESDPFAEIRITSLESVGSLLLGGTPVALNDVITAAQLTANQLTFVPVANQSGSPYDTFDFEVGDGTDFSTADYTLTVNVNAVNDPPTGDDNTVATNEDITYTFSVADFTVNYSDTESDPFAEIRITSLESVGSLLLGGTPVALNDVITAAQLSGNQLTFVPVANQSGSPYDTFDFEVGDGTVFSTADYTLTVNVNPVNDPPTGDDNTVATNEDITYTFSVADFTVNYNDPESDPFAEIRITSLESVGSLLLGGTPVALNDVITAAQLTANQLTFVPVANQSGAPYDTFDFEVGDGTVFSTADYTLTVNVNPVNDPPTGDDNTVATNEDITYTFSVADFTVNYNDPESDPFAEIRITSLESVGSLLLGGTPVALNDVITVAQLTANQLTFVPVANQSGAPYDTFDFEVGDGTDFSTADYTLTVNVNPVNDPPTGDDNTVATNEDITYTFSVADFTVNYSDPESNPFAEIRITSLESVGSLLLGGTPVALNDVITAAQLTANQLTFVPVANQSGSPYDTFDFEVGDGTGFSTADYTLTVNVNAVNDPPTASDNTVLTQEDITYVFTIADFSVSYSDAESDPLAEIRITSLESVGSLLLGGTPVALNDVITAAQLTANQLTFVPVAGQSGSPYDTFNFEVGDGTDFSTSDYTLTVNVGPVNDPPTGDDNTVATNEDVSYVFTVADFSINYSDPESDPLARIRITNLESVGSLLFNGSPVTLNQVINVTDINSGQLTFDPVANQSGSPYDSFDFEVGDATAFSIADYTLTVNVNAVNDPPTGDDNTVATNEDITYTFSVADFTVNYNDTESDPFAEIRITNLESVGSLLLGGTPVALNDVITSAQLSSNQLTFVPVANQSGSPYDTFDFEVGDGTDFSTADYTLTVNVNPVNDPPTGDDNTVATNEDITYTFSVADFTVNYSDTESDPFAEIRITNLESVGSLLLGGTPVALNDVITAAQLTANQLTFVPVANQSGAPYDTFDFEVGDGTDFSTADYTLTVNVNPVNDPPTGDDNTVATNEDITYTFSVADFTVNYSDPESNPFAEIRITNLESVGSLLLGGTPVALNDVITAAQLTANQLTFVPVANQSGSPYDTFDFEVGDGTGFSTADYTLTVNVNAVNDPPTASDNTVLTQEDITYVFTIADFSVSYSDAESDPLAEIRITSLESVGSLLLGGTPVALNDVITAAQLTANQLTFVPVAGQSGSPYDTFDFEVGDGTDFSTSDYTLTVNVGPVNDPPTGDDNTVATNEDVSYVFTVADFSINYSDPESDPLARIRITNLESVGSLLFNGSPVTLNQVINVTDINSGQLTFDPVANQSGSPYDSFDFEVGDATAFSIADYTLTVNVNAVNDPPTGDDNTVATNEDITYTFSVADFTVNYNDPESDPFAEIRITRLEAVGSLLLGGTPVALNDVITAAQLTANQLTFVPVANQSGSPYDTFDFEVGDGTDFSTADYTLTVNVNAVNDLPVAVADASTTSEDTPTSIDVFLNDNLGDTPTFISNVDNTSTQGGIVAINNNGTPGDSSDDFIDYTPPAGFNGTDTFDYTIEDVDGETSSGTVTITVNPINDVPVAVDDNAATSEESAIAIDVLINDNLGDIPTIISTVDNSTAQGGVAVINNNGTPADPSDDFIDYTPAVDFNGTDSFTYTIQDVDGETSTATVSITVSGINDTPLAVDDNANTIEETLIGIDVLANDNLGDPPTSIASFDPISSQGGTVQINNNGTPGDPSDDTIEFTPATGFTGTDTFSYTIEDLDGEQSTATVTVIVDLAPSTLVIYKGFSPNGDGSNDEWVIDGILFYPDNSVQVFNRWGNLVFKEQGYDNQSKVWFGQSNQGIVIGDNILPDGTYFYMVDLGDGSEAHSGYVMLKR